MTVSTGTNRETGVSRRVDVALLDGVRQPGRGAARPAKLGVLTAASAVLLMANCVASGYAAAEAPPAPPPTITGGNTMSGTGSGESGGNSGAGSDRPRAVPEGGPERAPERAPPSGPGGRAAPADPGCPFRGGRTLELIV